MNDCLLRKILVFVIIFLILSTIILPVSSSLKTSMIKNDEVLENNYMNQVKIEISENLQDFIIMRCFFIGKIENLTREDGYWEFDTVNVYFVWLLIDGINDFTFGIDHLTSMPVSIIGDFRFIGIITKNCICGMFRLQIL